MQEANTTLEIKQKRTWCYVQSPRVFDFAPCSCGNRNTHWSEYAEHLWCSVCEIDFVPKHNGIFDGPIPMRMAALLGISFDRINLETHQVERFDVETCINSLA